MKSCINIVIDASALIAFGFESMAKLVVMYNESVVFYVTQKVYLRFGIIMGKIDCLKKNLESC